MAAAAEAPEEGRYKVPALLVDTDRRARSRSVVTIADGCVNAGVGLLLGFFQHGKQPAEAITDVGVFFVQSHFEFLLYIWVSIAGGAVDACLDQSRARVCDFLLRPVPAHGRAKQGVGIELACKYGAHGLTGQIGGNIVGLTLRSGGDQYSKQR